ncbi:MAG: acetyl-CoA carboxylase biotin carboxyl carrier protein subunit, partial [Anaerolineales bacterium]
GGRENAGEVTAQMAGLIVDLQVDVGDRVEEGDVLMVQEAMKMQMPLQAPRSGRVAELTVEIGSEVEKGVLLARIAGSRDTKGERPVERSAEKA